MYIIGIYSKCAINNRIIIEFFKIIYIFFNMEAMIMENSKLEEKEIYEVDSKKYTVITRVSENCLGKESLKKLICNYAMRELQEND